ncbi:concanavalin A-like lectin/glucanase domain-containing protein [Xylaria nigripes]|nr:concanavalin A-like lectin/glucanase domain-containing protein [Xylaria nigripes]
MMSYPRSVPAYALLASVLLSPAAGQLSTKCNPMEKSCPPDPALGTAHTFYFNATPAEGLFTSEANPITFDQKEGAVFTISEQGNAPTLSSDFYFFFGRTEVLMKASPGQGIISSIVWGSDTLDEVDWEFKGGNDSFVFSNYFGKGNNKDFTTGGDHRVSGTIYDLHNYTSVWTKDKLEWHIDGELVRTLLPADANHTNNYPQTPMTLRLGSWAGGDTDVQAIGTVEWAGGKTDYSQGPFNMYVQSARVEDYSSGKEYTYSDLSGSWESIKITEGNSTAAVTVNKPPHKSLSQKWAELPQATRTGIYAAIGAVAGLLFIALIVYYFRQRGRGKKEAAMEAKMQEEERVELERFKRATTNPDDFNFDGTEYLGAAGKGGMSGTYTPIVESPPGSSAGLPEKTWDPTGAEPRPNNTPLLQDETTGSTSPIRSQSSGVPPSFPLPSSPVNRSSRMGSIGGEAGEYTDHPEQPQRPYTDNEGGYWNNEGHR